MYGRFVAEALQYFGLEYNRILDVQKGYRNEIYPVALKDGSLIQLTFYKSEPGIKRRIDSADAVSQHAYNQGLPARTSIDDRTLVLTSSKRTVYARLYDYLPGETISWEAYTKDHLKVLGKTMSDLHNALKDFKDKDQVSVIDEQYALLDRMDQYFTDPKVQLAIKKKLGLSNQWDMNKYLRLLDGCQKLPNSQQLHMDFVRGNILFEGTTLTGILDFEKTAVGHPLFDVARTLAFLFVDCKYKTSDQVYRYFIQSGYHKRGAATLDYYPGLLEALTEFFLLHDFYKFLKHNPYEYLNENEHFKRTISILTKDGVLNYT